MTEYQKKMGLGRGGEEMKKPTHFITTCSSENQSSTVKVNTASQKGLLTLRLISSEGPRASQHSRRVLLVHQSIPSTCHSVCPISGFTKVKATIFY